MGRVRTPSGKLMRRLALGVAVGGLLAGGMVVAQPTTQQFIYFQF